MATKHIQNRLKGSFRNIVNLELSQHNILDGNSWYDRANAIATEIGSMLNYSDDKATEVGAGILSALSPQVEWNQNVAFALDCVVGIKRQTNIQHQKAIRIALGENPIDVLGTKAYKTQNFYLAIRYPNNDWSMPVVDRHATPIYVGRIVNKKELISLANYGVHKRIGKAYIKASIVKGINRHKLQAMTWLQLRENKGITKS